MKHLLKLVKGRSGMLGLGAALGSTITRFVDGAGIGSTIGLGLVIYVIVMVISNMVLKDDEK